MGGSKDIITHIRHSFVWGIVANIVHNLLNSNLQVELTLETSFEMESK